MQFLETLSFFVSDSQRQLSRYASASDKDNVSDSWSPRVNLFHNRFVPDLSLQGIVIPVRRPVSSVFFPPIAATIFLLQIPLLIVRSSLRYNCNVMCACAYLSFWLCISQASRAGQVMSIVNEVCSSLITSREPTSVVYLKEFCGGLVLQCLDPPQFDMQRKQVHFFRHAHVCSLLMYTCQPLLPCVV